MNVTDALRQRRKPTYDQGPQGKQFGHHFNAVVDAIDAISAEHVRINDNDHFSSQGKATNLATFAKGQAGKLGRAQVAIKVMKEAIDKRRADLLPRPKDADPIKAAQRAEIRAHLRTLKPAERVALVNDPATDTIVLEAVFEGPAFLSGVSSAERADLAKLALQRSPATVAEIDEAEEAIELLETSTQPFAETLRASIAPNLTPEGFASWLAQNAPAPADYAAAVRQELAA